MGSAIILPETFSAPTGKVLRNDQILPSAGAIALFDAGHSLGGMGTAGVPADGAAIPNVCWDQAAAAIGSGNASTLGFVFNRLDGANFNLERTGKGGIHGYLSGSIAAGVGLQFEVSSALRDYIYENRSQSWYISAWDRITKPAAVQSPQARLEGVQFSPSATGNYLAFFDTTSDGAYPRTGANRLGSRVANVNGLGNSYRSVATLQKTGTTETSFNPVVALWGPNAGYSALAGTACPSYALYRLYIENLTVSGRTWAEVDAIDYALYQAAFGAGGRFADDTFTASPI